MSGSLAYNPKTGEALRVNPEGQWEPTRVARNPKTGEVLALDGEKWVPVGKGSTGSGDYGRGFGVGARNILEGALAIPGMIADTAMNFGAAVGLNEPPKTPASKIIPDMLGLPEAETDAGRVVGRGVQEVAAALPTMGAGALMSAARGVPGMVGRALSSHIPSQVAGAAGSGLAAGAAHESGADTIGELAAGAAGGFGAASGYQAMTGLGRLAQAAVQPFTQRGREAMAADTLAMASRSGDPSNLQARIVAGAQDTNRRVPGSPVTTAQAAQDPGLAVLEQGMRNDPTRLPGQGAPSGAVAIRDVEALRNDARTRALQQLQPLPNTEPAARGAFVRDALREGERGAKANVRREFQAIEASGADAAVPTAEIARRVGFAAHRDYGPGSGGMPAELADALTEFQKWGDLGGMSHRDGVSNIAFLQNIRSRLGGIAGKAAAQNDSQLASAAGRARSELDAALDDFARQGRGTDAAQVNQWRRAIQARRDMGATFGRDETGSATVGQILKRDPFNRPIMADESVAARALSSPDNLLQVLRAAGPRRDDALIALRSEFIDRLSRAATTTTPVADAGGNVQRALSPAGFTRFLDENRVITDRLFTGEQRARLDRLVRDFEETGTMQNAAKARGSDTAQNLTVANLIARATNGLIDPGNPLAQTVAGLGPVMRVLYQAPEAATRELLSQAIVDPNFAATLLSRATPRNIQRASTYLNSTMPDRVAIAARDASTRQTARTANALAVQQQQE